MVPSPPLTRADARRIAIGAGPAAVLVLVSLWEVLAVARAGDDTGTDAEWARAADIVRSRYQPGDLITFAPDWIDPVGRLHLGDLIPVDVAARMDADRYARVWQLSIRGARSADVRGARRTWSQSFGGVTAALYEREPAVVLYDFVDELPAARRESLRTGPPAEDIEEVGFEPHRCVRAVPMPNGAAVLVYPQVPLGTSIVGYVGLGDVFTRRDIRDPGRLVMRIGDEVVADVTAGVDDGWVRFEVATEPGTADVTVELHAVGANARQRRVCFAAESRR